MFKEFKAFISKGNVMDLAIGVIIGSAFADIVTAFTDSFIKPLLGLIGGADVQGTIPLWNDQALDYGSFISAVINFLIVAFILFLMVKTINTANKKSKEQLEKLSSFIPSGKRGNNKKSKEEKEPETKLCPFCYTEIAYKATRCPHCTSELEKEHSNID